MGTIPLWIPAAVTPDGSAGNSPAEIRTARSSAAPPSAHFAEVRFDGITSEAVLWSLRLPPDYASAPVLKLQYKMASAIVGNVIFAARLMAVTPGDAQDVDTDLLAAANTSAATTVPGTAGHLGEISMALVNLDGLAAGDFLVLHLMRDAATDTALGDAQLVAASLDYTTV